MIQHVEGVGVVVDNGPTVANNDEKEPDPEVDPDFDERE